MSSQQKQLIIIFFFLFAVSSIALNWNDVSWLFNYRVVGSLAYDFFNPYEDVSRLVSANNMVISGSVSGEDKNRAKRYPYSQKSNSIEISKIGIVAPVVIGENTDPKVLEKNLNQGTVVYPGSVMPGQIGQTVVLGHSAPLNWPKIKYDWVFSEINDLNLGDQINVYFNNRQYTYKVVEKNIIQVGQDVESNRLNGKNNILTLISCWPPGKNYMRITVQAELIES